MSDPEKDAAEDDSLALPTKLPTRIFAPSSLPHPIVYAINRSLAEMIPAEAKNALLDVKVKAEDGQETLMVIGAARFSGGWGLAIGASIDLDHAKNYEVEILGVKSWG